MSRGASLHKVSGRLHKSWQKHPAGWLLAAALGVYLFTRLYAIADYPIYFFSDEAVQSVLAQDFWHNGLRNAASEELPAFFQNGRTYNLGISVYLQMIPGLLLGRSVEVTRGTAALVTLLAPLWLGLTIGSVYRQPYGWLAALLLAGIPAWFLHSRTAFECSLAVTWYSGMLYFYLRFRSGVPKALYAAILCGALAFYSYSPAQMVVMMTAGLFFISDIGYLRAARGLLARGGVLALICALPYARFQLQHPGENLNHLQELNSYLVQGLPWVEKAGLFLKNYLSAFNPLYWFTPSGELARHTMGSFGYLPWLLLPLAAAGVGLAAARFGRWEYRIPLLALLAAPSAGALAGLGITRVLFFIIPITLLSSLAAGEGVDWALRRWKLPRTFIYLALWVVLTECSLFLLNSALVDGPTWSTDYGMNGMQYGARQVFAEIQYELHAHSGSPLVLSPTWANGTDILARFFLPDPSLIELASIDSWLIEKHRLSDNMLFILPPDELERAQNSGKFGMVKIEGSLPYPDGRPGFSFVHLRYIEQIDQIFQQEWQDRRSMENAQIVLDGQPVQVQYSRLDMGDIGNLFDSDENSLIRTLAANPLVLKLTFAAPRQLHGLALHIGGAASQLEIDAEVEGNDKITTWKSTAGDSDQLRWLEIDFRENLPVQRLEIFLKNAHDLEPGHVHAWGLQLK